MKFSVILIVLLFFFTNCAIAQDKEPELLKNISSLSSDSTEYNVDVTFKIDDDGQAKVLKVDSENPKLVQYVLEKFEKINVSAENYFVGKVMRYRFKFKIAPEDLAFQDIPDVKQGLIATFAGNGQKEGHPHSES